jgi:hypothetical protein
VPGDFPTGRTLSEFQHLLRQRIWDLFFERWQPDAFGIGSAERIRRRLVMPVGLLLVVDEANGGDTTAQEVAKRFHLLHLESQNVIDFYFLGWRWNSVGDRSRGIRFDLESYHSCRAALQQCGVRCSGGNAELILVDAHFEASLGPPSRSGRSLFYPSPITLNFREAITVNLSSRRDEKDIPPVGDFLQSIIQTAESVGNSARTGDGHGVVFSISDKLGLATAEKSFLDFIFDKWGKIIGAKKLAALAVRDIGPVVNMEDLSLGGISPTRDD